MYENIEQMYDQVYKAMVDCGVACYVDNTEVYAVLQHPTYVLYVNEVGINTNQKSGGSNNRRRVIGLANDEPANEECSTSEVRASVMCYTAATGEPVMCVIIFQGESKNLPLWVSLGFDWLVNYDGINGIENALAFFGDDEFIQANSGPGGIYPGGPKCRFREKDIPCYITASPHGGIDPEILMDTLRILDNLNVFERSNDLSPFVLLDGHQSQFDETFLRYINDKRHRWSVAIGVPYGTQVWQVGDSSEQNGAFKMSFDKWHDLFFDKKRHLGIPPAFIRTDIVPLVLRAFQERFAKVESNQKAISERGWGPENLDRKLLQNAQILSTRNNSIQQGSCHLQDQQPSL
jgi:hypothetical protein